MKEALKTRSQRLNELQTIFNEFIRLRDKDLPCISCDTTKNVKYDAGHLWSAGNYEGLRFNEDNVHKQCSFNCNKARGGNFGEYEERLKIRIGSERVQWLRDNRKIKLELTRDDIEDLKKVYRGKIKKLKLEG